MTRPSKKPASPSSLPFPVTQGKTGKVETAPATKARLKPDSRWQRSKRYGWDSR